MIYKNFIKPCFDKIFALIGLVIALPFVLIIVILLAIFQNGKVFFTQQRPGKNQRIFKLLKFKTMRDDKDKEGNLLADEVRLTWIGKFIRKTSLDEIPQLVNVLKGDMSFVGPRPLLVEYIPLYNVEQLKRHEVTPGISGWAQVNGRNAISWEDKFTLDVWYVQNQSFLLDLRIIFLTIKKIFIAEGISSEGMMTTKKFEGTKNAR